MPDPLTPDQFDELKRFITPTVSNAVELFGVRRRTEGFMLPGIECRFPDLGVMVGYAATATFCAWEPATRSVDMAAYYQHILSQPLPRVLVAQDLDDVPIGALVGEVNSSVHRALGCVGHVTNGGVRDLDECHSIGFHLFSGCVQVAHAYVHLEGFGEPVDVGGVTVCPGDLLHADQHGVCLIPQEVAPRLAEACRAMEDAERPLVELARSPDFAPARFLEEQTRFRGRLAELQRRYREGTG
jgi:4-hydroxy-4-methyl-2-oxoglutarate aldolase